MTEEAIMTQKPETEFQRATPVLRSGDYSLSRSYYTEKLGFSVIEEGGDPPRFGIFRRGRSFIFVNAWQGPPSPDTKGWDAYLHVAGLPALYAEYQAVDAGICRAMEETVYGMREFEVRDPDGNVICFGEDTDPPKSA